MNFEYIVRRGDGVMPFFQEVPAFLWGDVEYDSDGDARWPTDQEWTELDVSRRDREHRAVAITPNDVGQRESRVEADDADDARLAAVLLAQRTAGAILDSSRRPLDLGEFALSIGDLDARLARADAVRERFLSPDFRPWW